MTHPRGCGPATPQGRIASPGPRRRACRTRRTIQDRAGPRCSPVRSGHPRAGRRLCRLDPRRQVRRGVGRVPRDLPRPSPRYPSYADESREPIGPRGSRTDASGSGLDVDGQPLALDRAEVLLDDDADLALAGRVERRACCSRRWTATVRCALMVAPFSSSSCVGAGPVVGRGVELTLDDEGLAAVTVFGALTLVKRGRWPQWPHRHRMNRAPPASAAVVPTARTLRVMLMILLLKVGPSGNT